MSQILTRKVALLWESSLRGVVKVLFYDIITSNLPAPKLLIILLGSLREYTMQVTTLILEERFMFSLAVNH